jgi:hypothetical protein
MKGVLIKMIGHRVVEGIYKIKSRLLNNYYNFGKVDFKKKVFSFSENLEEKVFPIGKLRKISFFKKSDRFDSKLKLRKKNTKKINMIKIKSINHIINEEDFENDINTDIIIDNNINKDEEDFFNEEDNWKWTSPINDEPWKVKLYFTIFSNYLKCSRF